MLHKKTEYRLQYGKLNKELRRKIWQDNISLRKSRFLSNQTTHYWEYQLRDEISDCENGDEEEDDGPLPPNRQKHRNLREQYCHQAENAQLLPLAPVHRDAHEIAVQTPEWNGAEADNRLHDGSEEELMRNMSSLTLPEAKESHSRPSSPTPLKSSRASRPRTALSLAQPSRTSRKLFSEPKRTHFVPFGWNEEKTDVGHKQTYNVRAPQKEVHESARLASQRRKAAMEKFLAEEKHLKYLPRSREREHSNSSSLWLSEYQEQFSIKNTSRNSRPLSAPPAPRQPMAWRHS